VIFPLAEKIVDWATLGKVVAAAMVAGVCVTTAFALTILGATRFAEMRRNGRPVEATGFAVLAIAGAAVCIAGIVGGIIVMTTK
jgi:multisubunit Na+/H+ antiporter MnhB subunit